jgi:DNA repair exonuclease SbcCD ATPase subunit
MSNDVSLAQAEAEFARAKSELARALATQNDTRRSDLIANLKSVRQELRKLRPKFTQLKSRVLAQQAEHENIHRAIQIREDHVSELLASQPDCYDYLPDDPECLQWAAAIEAVRKETEQLRAHLASQPNLYALRLEGVELSQRIENLQFSEASLITLLAGKSSKSWGGESIPEAGGTLSGVL